MSSHVINLRALYSGGNGDLFVGQRSDTGANVVVKFLREHHLPHARKAFLREVRILSRGIRGLVPLVFANTEAERPYYVMPYLQGGPLSRYKGQLGAGQLERVAADLASTLATLHAARVAHGDIKPDNVLVSDDGRLQVADPLGNGIGCTVFFSQNRGGTPGYWAPEIRAGGQISCAGDVYSYGATLYELQTGRKPQDGQRLDSSSVGYANSTKIQQIISVCCQQDPAARPTMQEVGRLLQGVQWKDIELERKQTQERVRATCVLGGVLLLGLALANG